MTEDDKKGYRLSARDARLFTGLALAVFITSHLVNHALGLVSIEAMEAYRKVHSAIWQSPPGVVVLYGSIAVHLFLALYALYQRSHLRLNIGTAVQLVFGLMVPIFLIEHVVGSRVVPFIFDFDATYFYAISFLYIDDRSFWQHVRLR